MTYAIDHAAEMTPERQLYTYNIGTKTTTSVNTTADIVCEFDTDRSANIRAVSEVARETFYGDTCRLRSSRHSRGRRSYNARQRSDDRSPGQLGDCKE
jgi:hypothetical protein